MGSPKVKQKLFIVRKYVRASSAAEAIKKEKGQPVDDCFVDDDWRHKATDRLDAIGFDISPKNEE